MDLRLLQPSLNLEERPKSYNIYRLYAVALVGGIFPTVMLGSRNALWLKVPKWNVLMLIVFAFPFFLLEISVYAVLLTHPYYLLLAHSFGLVFALIYVILLRIRYNGYLSLAGKAKPMLKDAIIWTLVGAVIRILLLYREAFYRG